MGAGKPLISILMAVYEPRMDWLEEQLNSLNGQTYPNLRLYVRDDCSPTVSFGDIESLARRCITAFPYTIERNEQNLGSNGTFERLTREAEGEYFAYCDQDDVWLPDKLSVLQREIEQSGALLVCSDMYIIDGEGQITAHSITEARRHHVFRSGKGLAEGLLISNFVTGCTMLVRAGPARASVPFCPYMVHDHYIALCCAAVGEIRSLAQPLIRYRIHGGNQTGLMAGITDKRSYGRVRIDTPLEKFRWLEKHLSCMQELREAIALRREWMEARHRQWASGKGKRLVWKYRQFSPRAALFEVALRWLPGPGFRFAIWLARKNVI